MSESLVILLIGYLLLGGLVFAIGLDYWNDFNNYGKAVFILVFLPIAIWFGLFFLAGVFVKKYLMKGEREE